MQRIDDQEVTKTLAILSHNAEVEGSSPSLTTKINDLRVIFIA